MKKSKLWDRLTIQEQLKLYNLSVEDPGIYRLITEIVKIHEEEIEDLKDEIEEWRDYITLNNS